MKNKIKCSKCRARLRIPTEVWTDVFKLLPRRVLVQQIAPVCYYFKEITNKNVKNVHVIESANQFTKKLNKDDPEANQQLENLAGSNCQLASQFRLTFFWIGEKSQATLRHCPDLFDGCKIGLDIVEENKSSTVFLASLTQLKEAKPIEFNVTQHIDQVFDFWHHPTFQNCIRNCLFFWSSLSDTTRMTAFVNIYGWLHHQPMGGTDCDGATAQHVRCMIISSTSKPVNIDWLLDRCTQDIQQAHDPIDRRSFVLSFECSDSDWPSFGQFHRVENKLTGEVLLLDSVLDGDGKPIENEYRLRRCLAEEEANGKEFYAGTFKREDVFEVFNTDEKKPEEISDKNVKTIHVITEAKWFNEKLEQGDPKANQQLQHLAGNDCQLVSQFRLIRFKITQENKAILRHCIDLFRGCQLAYFPYTDEKLTHFNECLTYLEPAKPIIIYICLKNLFNQQLRHPTIWNCNHIKLTLSLPLRSVDGMPIALTLLDWLHHQPIEVDGSKDGVAEPIVRCLIIRCNYKDIQGTFDWLINACMQNLQQSQDSLDRRQFVISLFDWSRNPITLLDQFERRHNHATGEVLLLECEEDTYHNTSVYHLRRCLTEEAANRNKFYGKIRNDYWDDFDDKDRPRVAI